MKLLLLTPTFPYPPQSGADLRVYNLIRNLSSDHDIHLLSVVTELPDEDSVSVLRCFCSSVVVAPVARRAKLVQIPAVLGRLIRGEPFALKYFYAPGVKKILREVASNEFDVVQCEHSYMAHYLQYLPPGVQAKKVLSLHNVSWAQYYRMFEKEQNLSRKLKYLLEWVPMLRWEPKMARLFDKALVVSDSDRNLLQVLIDYPEISVIPNGVDSHAITPYSLQGRGKSLIFVGSFDYDPNVDAVHHFYRDIFPLVQKQIPGIRFLVVGRRPPASLRKLTADPDVTVTGGVQDVLPYYQQALLAVVALRSGGGTRLKILEAMATGTPVVSTTVGCEGIEAQNGAQILVADRPQEFADSVVQLCRDRNLWQDLSAAGREFVEQRYDWKLISASLNKMYRDLLQN